MKISATDFQLRVNEFFTKLVQGEEVIINRYGKEFAVLLSYDQYQSLKDAQKANQVVFSEEKSENQNNDQVQEFSREELIKLLKIAIKSL